MVAAKTRHKKKKTARLRSVVDAVESAKTPTGKKKETQSGSDSSRDSATKGHFDIKSIPSWCWLLAALLLLGIIVSSLLYRRRIHTLESQTAVMQAGFDGQLHELRRETLALRLDEARQRGIIRSSNIAIVDLGTDEVVWSHDNQPAGIASQTKLALAAVAYARGQEGVIDLDACEVTISQKSFDQVGDYAGIYPGQIFSYRNAIELMLVGSMNDVAYALAESLPGGVSETQNSMEQLVSMLQPWSSYRSSFPTVTGFDFRSLDYMSESTPEIVGLLAGAIAESEAESVAQTTQRSLTASDCSGGGVTVANTFEAVESLDNILLSKTGYTNIAGGSLTVVTQATAADRIAIVTLDNTFEGRFRDVEYMHQVVTSTYRLYEPFLTKL